MKECKRWPFERDACIITLPNLRDKRKKKLFSVKNEMGCEIEKAIGTERERVFEC